MVEEQGQTSDQRQVEEDKQDGKTTIEGQRETLPLEKGGRGGRGGGKRESARGSGWQREAGRQRVKEKANEVFQGA